MINFEQDLPQSPMTILHANSNQPYSAEDISAYVRTFIKKRLGDYAGRFLIEGKEGVIFDEWEGFPYRVIMTPPVDMVNREEPINLWLDKSKQLESTSVQYDAFDDINNIKFRLRGKCQIKILFPYHLTHSHWLTCEILIHRNQNVFEIIMTAHDPLGGGCIDRENFEILKETIQRRIREAVEQNAEFNFENKISPYTRRQTDDVSNSVIVAEETIQRGLGKRLNEKIYLYLYGAIELRKKHLEEMKKFLDGKQNPVILEFIKRNTSQSLHTATSSLFSAPSLSHNVKITSHIEPFRHIKPRFYKSNKAQQHFLKNSYHENQLEFKTWYDDRTLLYLLHSVEDKKSIPYISTISTYKNCFDTQLCMLWHFNKKNILFICLEPYFEFDHFICGILSQNKLLIVNPMGKINHPDFYYELSKTVGFGLEIYASKTVLQKYQDQDDLYSGGPICVELIRNWLGQRPEDIFAQLKETQFIQYHRKTNIEDQEIRYSVDIQWVDITPALPNPLLQLLDASSDQDYQHTIMNIRQKHFSLLQPDNIHPYNSQYSYLEEDYWEQCENHPLQRLMRLALLERTKYRDMGDLLRTLKKKEEYKLLLEEIEFMDTVIVKQNLIFENPESSNNSDDEDESIFEARTNTYKRKQVLFDKELDFCSREYGIRKIFFESKTDGRVTFIIISRTYLQFPFLFDVLKNIPWKEKDITHDGTSPEINFYFDLNQSSKSEIERVFKEILAKLKSLNVPEKDSNDFHQALIEYFEDFNQDFPREYLINPPISTRELSASQPSLSIAKEMRQAIWQGDPLKMLKFLQLGYSANTVVEHDTLLSYAINSATQFTSEEKFRKQFQEKRNSSLQIMQLLIEYEVNTNQEDQGSFTSLERVISGHSIKSRHPEELEVTLNIIRILNSSPYATPHINVHPSFLNTPIGKYLAFLNSTKASAKAVARSLYYVFPDESDCLLCINSEVGSLRLKVKKLSEISSEEEKQMLELFIKSPLPWQGRLNDPELKDYFNRTIKKGLKGVYVNLITIDGKIHAYSVERAFDAHPIVKNTLTHHILLAVATKFISDHYPRLMTLISSLGGYSLKQLYFTKLVFSTFEALSQDSFLQIRGIRYYPKKDLFLKYIIFFLSKYLYPEENFETIDNACYVEEKLTSPAKKPNPHSFWQKPKTPSDNSLDFYREFLERPNWRLVIAYLDDPENLYHLSRAIDFHLAGFNFRDLINYCRNSYYQLFKNLPTLDECDNNSNYTPTLRSGL